MCPHSKHMFWNMGIPRGMFYRRNIYNHHGTILFREGNVSTRLLLLPVSAIRSPRLEDWRALCLLISVFTHPLPARDFPEQIQVVTQKRTFLDPIPKSLPIREVNEISPSNAYQRGQEIDHFLTAFLSEVIFASLGTTGAKRGTTQLYVWNQPCHSSARCYPTASNLNILAERKDPLTPDSILVSLVRQTISNRSHKFFSEHRTGTSKVETCQAVG